MLVNTLSTQLYYWPSLFMSTILLEVTTNSQLTFSFGGGILSWPNAGSGPRKASQMRGLAWLRAKLVERNKNAFPAGLTTRSVLRCPECLRLMLAWAASAVEIGKTHRVQANCSLHQGLTRTFPRPVLQRYWKSSGLGGNSCRSDSERLRLAENFSIMLKEGEGVLTFLPKPIASAYQPAVPSSQKQLCSAKCSDLAQCCISTHVSKLNVLDRRFCNPVFWVIRVNFLNRHGLIISWQLFVARDEFLWLITLWLQIKCTQAVIGKRADNKE